MELQANLLRFLQEKTIYRLGSTHSIAVDVRVIAASHVNLAQAVARGVFREDLYYRLNVLALDVPPLRERKDDLLPLAEHFFHTFSSERAPRVKGFSGRAAGDPRLRLAGNVRELINRVRRAMVMAEGRLILPQDLGLSADRAAISVAQLDDARIRAERDAIDASLQRAGTQYHAGRARPRRVAHDAVPAVGQARHSGAVACLLQPPSPRQNSAAAGAAPEVLSHRRDAERLQSRGVRSRGAASPGIVVNFQRLASSTRRWHQVCKRG